MGSIEVGVGLLIGALIVNASLLLVLRRIAPRSGSYEPLLPRGLRAPPPGSASAKWGIGGLLVLATALRLHALEAGPWLDEIDTWVHYARRPLGEILTSFDSQNQHLVYSVLARVSIVLFGDGVAQLRLPAVVLGVLSVWALWHFALRITGRREALFAAALLTVSYHHVWFSQNARGYTGLLLFTLLGSTCFLDLLARREPRGLATPLAYGFWMALAAATHATAVLVVAAHGLIWLALVVSSTRRTLGPNRWVPGLGFLFAASLGFLAYARVLPQFLETLMAPTMPGQQTQWKEPLWLIGETFRVLALGLPGGRLTLVLGLFVGGLGLASYARQGLSVLAVLLLGAFLTALAMVATSHNLWPRLFFFSAGFFVLIGVRGFAAWVALTARAGLQSLSAGLLTAILTLACLTSAASLPRVYGPKQDFRGALDHVQASRGLTDAVVTVDMTVMPYRELYGAGWSAVDNLPGLEAIERIHPRTWLVYTTPTRLRSEHPDIWRHMDAQYEESRTFPGTVSGGEVVVMTRSRPSD
jgi:mannosyltransferase